MNRREVLDQINDIGYEETFNALKDAIETANADIEDAQAVIKSAEQALVSQQEGLYWFAKIAQDNEKLTAYKEERGSLSYQVITSDDKQWRIDVETNTPYKVAVLKEVTPIILADATAGTERGLLTSPETEQPEVQQPETEQPEVQQPETEQPEVQQPETEQPKSQEAKFERKSKK